jgi:hypothetical protein
MSEHDPRVRYCTEIVGIPASELRDDLTCPACDEGIRLMMLDPDVEVLAPPAHLAAEVRSTDTTNQEGEAG